MEKTEETNTENPECGLSPEVAKELTAILGRKFQQNLLRKLRMGPINPYDSHEEITLELDLDEASFRIEGCLDGAITDSLIEDLLRKGFASRDDDGTLTGLGPYAEWELTCIEERVLDIAMNCKRKGITALGVKRRLPDVEITTGQVRIVLDELIRKGYLEGDEDSYIANPLSMDFG